MSNHCHPLQHYPQHGTGIRVYAQKSQSTGSGAEKKAIELCLEYGIPVCAGTDSIGSVCNDGLTRMGESLLTELGIYHEYGMSNMQVIQAATAVAAQMLRIEDETGTLEEGKCADMILVDGNPARQLEDLKKLVMTVRAGEILYRRA